jgi:hypothetical protein
MKPLNSQERNKQFLIFLAFFLVTVFLVVSVTYFNAIYNPKRHHEIIIQENAEQLKEMNGVEVLRSRIDSLFSTLNKIRSIQNSAEMQTELGKGIAANGAFSTELKSKVGSENILYRYSDVFDFSFNLLGDLQKLRESQERDKIDAARLKADNIDLKEKFEEYKAAHPF